MEWYGHSSGEFEYDFTWKVHLYVRWTEQRWLFELVCTVTRCISDEIVFLLQKKYFRIFYSFDMEINSWEPLASMNHRHCYSSAIVWNEHIFIVGGLNMYGLLPETESFDTNTNVWTTVASMILHRSHFGLIESSGFLYAIGFDKIIEKFDPDKKEWKEVCKLNIMRTKNLMSDLMIVLHHFRLGRFRKVTKLHIRLKSETIGTRSCGTVILGELYFVAATNAGSLHFVNRDADPCF